MTAARTLQVVGSLAAFLLVGLLLYQASIANDLLLNSRNQNAGEGRVIPVQVKDVTVFMTNQQNEELLWVRRGTYASAGIAALVVLVYGAKVLWRR